jgi:hypothetical protein
VPLYNLLLTSAWETIRQFGLDHKYLGAQTGMAAILHTWGQNLAFHPHVHCIVPGSGLTRQNTWKHTKGDGKFLYPVKALSKVFRGKLAQPIRLRSTPNIINHAISSETLNQSARGDQLYSKCCVFMPLFF